MKIKEIIEFQTDFSKKINVEAEIYHPKLFGILNYDDITNDKYDYDKIDDFYITKIKPQVRKHRDDVKYMIKQFSTELIENSIQLFGYAGINLNDASRVDDINQYNPDFFIPSPEIVDIYNALYEQSELYSFSVFWNKTVTVYDGYRQYKILPHHRANGYIEEARKIVHVKYKDLNKVLIDSVNELKELPSYFIKAEPINSYTSSTLPKAVNRHKVLYKLKEQLAKGEIKDHKYYISRIDIDGNITISGED